MSTVIKIKTSRDYWLEQKQTIDQLYAIPATDPVTIDLQNEGISLEASGLLQVIDKWVRDSGRDPVTVLIETPNVFEHVPYGLKGRPHFFERRHTDKYLVPPVPINQSGQLFAFFVGCHTIERQIMIQDIYDHYQDNFLISVMRSEFQNQDWPEHIWNLGSLDNLHVQDQYKPGPNTNRSLLKFYDQFQIELIAESVVRGPSFFPTEKTVRPIMGSRPFLAFAPKHFVKHLQNFGFKTFASLWNEDYDNFEGIERWHAIRATVDGIIEHGYDCNLAQDIVKYNYDHLGTIQYGKV
jgi:hypothetical protein